MRKGIQPALEQYLVTAGGGEGAAVVAAAAAASGKAQAGARRKRPAVPLRWFKNPQGQRKSGTPESRQPKNSKISLRKNTV